MLGLATSLIWLSQKNLEVVKMTQKKNHNQNKFNFPYDLKKNFFRDL